MNEPKEVDLRRTEVALLRMLDGYLQGENLAIRKGSGSTKDDPRLYLDSDDARLINWPLSARRDEIYVNQTKADRELRVTFIADMSARMFFGTQAQEKRNTLISVIWSLAVLLNGGSNKMAAAVAYSSKSPRWFRSGSGQRHRLNLVSFLRSIPEEKTGPVDMKRLVRGVARNIKGRGELIFIVTDGLGSPEWLKSLRVLTRNHTVYVIRITDPWDLKVENVGVIPVENPETKEVVWIDTSDGSYCGAVAEAAAAQANTFTKGVSDSKAILIDVKTDGNWAHALINQLQNVAANYKRAGRRVA